MKKGRQNEGKVPPVACRSSLFPPPPPLLLLFHYLQSAEKIKTTSESISHLSQTPRSPTKRTKSDILQRCSRGFLVEILLTLASF